MVGQQLMDIQNDIIEELLDLGMDFKLVSLWWTSTYTDEDERAPKMGRGGKSWDVGHRFRRAGKGIQEMEKTRTEGMRGWLHFYRAKSVSPSRKCDRVVSHVLSTALNWSVNFSWRLERVRRGRMAVKDPAI